MPFQITVLPQQQHITAPAGANLLDTLRSAGLAPDAPCGGTGACGKCRVRVGGREILACQTTVAGDMTVTLPVQTQRRILTDGIAPQRPAAQIRNGPLLAFDIGTTTVVGYLLDGASGQTLACESRANPQAAFGADVISRIQHALKGEQQTLTACIRRCVTEIAGSLCGRAQVDAAAIQAISVVGNPAMQQLFLGLPLDNLAQIPFRPALTRAEIVAAGACLPRCPQAKLLIVPDISGFVGADTLACVLATGLDQAEEMTLLVDIGTNGEMVLGNRRRMAACSTAAGPALEGAQIQCGMNGCTGAIDHVWIENGSIRYSVIGGADAAGICGSGLIDAAAAALDSGLINSRGRIQNEARTIRLTDRVVLTQADIRELQTAKGAIMAGIRLLAAHLGVSLAQIRKVYLAGAFGTFLNPESACRIGLLPPELQDRIEAVGNAAGSGARLLARDAQALAASEQLVARIEYLDLATLPDFPRCFAESMRF